MAAAWKLVAGCSAVECSFPAGGRQGFIKFGGWQPHPPSELSAFSLFFHPRDLPAVLAWTYHHFSDIAFIEGKDRESRNSLPWKFDGRTDSQAQYRNFDSHTSLSA